MKEFSNYNIIREYRKKCGYTQEKLAEMIEITPRQIQRIENNPCNTKISTLKKIIVALQICDSDIITLIKNSD